MQWWGLAASAQLPTWPDTLSNIVPTRQLHSLRQIPPAEAALGCQEWLVGFGQTKSCGACYQTKLLAWSA